MEIPKELETYYIKPSTQTINFVKSIVNKIGFLEYFEHQYETFLDCTKVWKSGQRPVMTTYITYKYEISNTLEMIEEYAEDKDKYIKMLLDLHNRNLYFEANNPYEYKPTKVKQSNPRRKENKQLTIETLDDKPKKETASERKLKQSAMKLNKLSFNFKPAQQ